MLQSVCTAAGLASNAFCIADGTHSTGDVEDGPRNAVFCRCGCGHRQGRICECQPKLVQGKTGKEPTKFSSNLLFLGDLVGLHMKKGYRVRLFEYVIETGSQDIQE